MRAGACRPAWRARRVASRSAPRRAHDVSKGGRCRLRAQGWTPSPAAPPLTLRLSHLARAPQSTGRPPAQARLHCRPRPAAPRAWPAPAAEREACIGEQRRTSVPPRLRLAGPLVPPAAAPRSAGPGWGCAALMATRVCAAARASASCAGPALVVSRQRGACRTPQSVASCCLVLGAGAHHVCPGVSRAGQVSQAGLGLRSLDGHKGVRGCAGVRVLRGPGAGCEQAAWGAPHAALRRILLSDSGRGGAPFLSRRQPGRRQPAQPARSPLQQALQQRAGAQRAARAAGGAPSSNSGAPAGLLARVADRRAFRQSGSATACVRSYFRTALASRGPLQAPSA